jgi:hypothetical protein
MICQLCKQKEADKKNTHYLTDSIIRSCLNQGGDNIREKGFYFDVSTDKEFIDLNFQRNTSLDKIESALGRPPSDKEIEKAKQIPFSVDYHFCSDCEKIFTDIENKFLTEILPRFRETSLEGKSVIDITDVKYVRLFFYLQLWRTHICNTNFNMNENIVDDMRNMILNHKSIETAELTGYPLSIVYLQTLGGAIEFTRNFVGIKTGQNPYVIFMNDFIIKFYDSQNAVDLISRMKYININEDIFHVYICSDENRKRLIAKCHSDNKVDAFIQKQKEQFIKRWSSIFGKSPDQYIVNKYIVKIADGGYDNGKYSEERVIKIQNEIIANYQSTSFNSKRSKKKKRKRNILPKQQRRIIHKHRIKHQRRSKKCKRKMSHKKNRKR